MVGDCANLVIETIPARGIDQEQPALFQNICRGLQRLKWIIDMLDHIPQRDCIKVICIALLPKIAFDGMFMDFKVVFCSRVLRAAVAWFNSDDIASLAPD